MSYKDLNTSSSFLFSYLLATGYLTVEEKITYDKYILKIPNKEITRVFQTEVVARYYNIVDDDLTENLRNSFMNGNSERIEYLFESRLLSSFSYYEMNKEKNYQILVASALSMILPNYKVKMEVNSGMGRSDVIAIPKDENNPGFIIETKCLRSKPSTTKFHNSAVSAINQIEGRGYLNEFKDKPIKKVLLYG